MRRRKNVMVGANLPLPELNRVKSKRPGFDLPQEMFQIEYIWLKFVCASFPLILLCLVAFCLCWSNCTSAQSIALLGKVAKILQRLRKPYPQIGTLALCSFQDHIYMILKTAYMVWSRVFPYWFNGSALRRSGFWKLESYFLKVVFKVNVTHANCGSVPTRLQTCLL